MRQLLSTSVLVLALWGCNRPEPLPASPSSPATPDVAVSTPVIVEPVQMVPSTVIIPPAPQVSASLSLPGIAEPRLRISDTAELTVRARVEHLAGEGTLSLLLVSPDGNAYAVGAWQVTGDGAPIERDLTVPVRGTAIEDHRLTGDWKAQLTLDGQPVNALVVGME